MEFVKRTEKSLEEIGSGTNRGRKASRKGPVGKEKANAVDQDGRELVKGPGWLGRRTPEIFAADAD